MNTNATFKKIIQALCLDPAQVEALFQGSGLGLGQADIENILNARGGKPMPAYVLATFLNNLIAAKRGKKADAAEQINKHQKLTNNDVLKKLRIAFNLHEQDVRDVLALATIELTKSDLSALFRKPDNTHYKACDDELLADFIEALGQWLRDRPAAENHNHG